MVIATADTNKRYYWLKLKEDFFTQKEIKQLRKMAGGDTFTIIYLKMLLRSLEDGGRLYYEGIEQDFVSELALDLDEEVENVKLTVAYLMSKKILVQGSEDEYELLTAGEMTGSECESARRMRRMRMSQPVALPSPRPSSKTNAERQRSFRAKKNCQERHIPLIEDYMNQKRYNGNYYIVFQRDRYKCAICQGTDNLCVHHIDGYFDNKPENSEANKMIVLCRSCHMQVHCSGLEIPQDLLDAIGYDNNSSNVTSDALVTASDEDIEIDIEIDKRDKSKKHNRKAFVPPTLDEIKAYADSIGYKADVQFFFDYYDSANWKRSDGKPVLNWKQTMQSWKKRDEGNQTKGRSKDWHNPALSYAQREYKDEDYGDGFFIDLDKYGEG